MNIVTILRFVMPKRLSPFPDKTSIKKYAISTGSGSSHKKPEKQFTFFYSKESPFSQHHMCSFTVDDVTYNCAEQYMMHRKAVMFGDEKSAGEIMKATKPMTQKRLGRTVKPFDPAEWSASCQAIVKKGNLAKFTQNAALKRKLFETAGTVLVEASPRDRIWGIGLSATNPDALDRSKWRGRNLLGHILTEVREELLLSDMPPVLEDDEF